MKLPQRTHPKYCKLNFKEKPYCEFYIGLCTETNGYCKKCNRSYILNEDNNVWEFKKYDMLKASESYGGRRNYGFFLPDKNWANKVLEDADMWNDYVIEYAKNILKDEDLDSIQ